ncbi:endonuclease/exonuclease/phosphatase family protein [Crateriforma spongiae]|uniref:endonuclease/exonuclease/phosphatase family protein n=1 Tax=Crateriforma spongiae TaxID=2724528 RepID=UPI0014470E38|nr:endonuclease/exonuclease/phosphatase family protein [Crateriforma spongiae]
MKTNLDVFSNAAIGPRLWLACGIAAVLALAGSPSSADENDAALSVMTWNVEWFYDEYRGDNHSDLSKKQSAPDRDRWEWKRDAVAEAIAEVRPTVVALQEVENRRVLWYLTRALDRNHREKYREYQIDGTDHYTEQDVGLLCHESADVVAVSQFHQSKSMRATERFYNLSKHMLATVEVPVGDTTEHVHILILHLRARAEAEDLRIRQARLAHLWIADRVAAGEHVIVLGDMNTEEDGSQTRPESDVAALCGWDTATKDDDLIDLHDRLPASGRRTHLLPGKQFDRILVTPSLIEDEPGVPDLVFDEITVRSDVNIRGDLDTQSEHWDGYWSMKDQDRDISDHHPLVATFRVK